MKPIQVNFKPSLIFIGLIISVTLAACLTLILMPLGWQVKLPMIFISLLLAVYTILHHGMLHMPGSVLGLKVDIKNALYVLHKDGREVKVRVSANTTVTPYLVVMNFREINPNLYWRIFSQTVIVLPDSTDAEAFRQLRVWLRWAHAVAV